MKNPQLVRKYRVLDRDIALYDDKLHGFKSCETKLYIPTPANRKLMQAELDALRARQQMLDAPDEVFAIMRDHLSNFLDGLQLDLDNWYEAPSVQIAAGIGWTEGYSFTSIMRWDARPDSMRKKILETRMVQYDELFAAMFEYLADLPANELNELLMRMNHMRDTVEIELGDAHEFMLQLTAEELKDLTDKMQAFADTVMAKWIGKLEEIIAQKGGVPKGQERAENDTIALDIEGYRAALKAHGVDLDEMLSWYEAEVEKTRSECIAIANSLDIPEKPVKTMEEVNNILLKYAGPADSAEEMFRRARGYAARGTAAAREFVWLPEDAACPPHVMHKQWKLTCPWGNSVTANPYGRPFQGYFFLNEDNYGAITDGWIKINSIHEANPGHYTQSMRALLDPLPETIKRGAMQTCMMEAMCIRTEKLFEFVFAEDPFYPLFTAYRRHHTSVRIMVDLWLRYFGKTIGDVVDLYIKELGFDRVSARKQVQAHENDNGYFTTYYYGYKKVAEWEKLYGFDNKEYTELLFSVGRVSLDTFERFLKLSEEDRFSYTHEFASLIQFR